MALPRLLKNQNAFIDGVGYIGEIETMNPPKLARKFEGWRGAGLDAEVQIDMGMEAMEAELTFGGLPDAIFNSFGTTRLDGVQIRMVGAYQRDDTGQVAAVEQVMRGRFAEIDQGETKTGGDSKTKVKCNAVYYKLLIDGREVVEVDVLNLVCRVNGVDRLAEQRAAIGA